MPTDESDTVLSDLYNRASTEKSPESLDNAVLAMARSELTTARSGWFQPLAIAATLVIGVGFALRITDYGTVAEHEVSAPIADMNDYPAQHAPIDAELDTQAFEEALEEPTTQAQEPTQAQVTNQEIKKRTSSRAPQVEELSRQANERAKTELNEAMRDLPAAAEFEPKAAVSGSALLAREQRSEKNHACSDQSEDVAQWLNCIENLRESGDEDAAALAEEALYLRFPELKPDE